MTNGDRDRDLRDAFARLRAEERARTPAYAAVVARARLAARPRRRLHALTLASLSGAAVVALALTWLALAQPWGGPPPKSKMASASPASATTRLPSGAIRSGTPPPLAPAVMRSVRWEAPTDFLLRTSGGELLRTVPSIGGSAGWKMMPHTGAPRPRRPTPDTIRDQGRAS
jgi:hypothetical protein